jgi:hypothetical protein
LSSDWSSDVCSSDLGIFPLEGKGGWCLELQILIHLLADILDVWDTQKSGTLKANLGKGRKSGFYTFILCS